MNNETLEFNRQLELDVLVNGLTEIKHEYIKRFAIHNLTEVVIPEGVTSIGWSAFEGLINLNNIMVPDTVTSIGEWAFAWCEGLTNITIPNSVKRIRNNAFRFCRSLVSVSIGNAETLIGNAFEDCHKLTNFTVEGKIMDEVTLRQIIQGVYFQKN